MVKAVADELELVLIMVEWKVLVLESTSKSEKTT